MGAALEWSAPGDVLVLPVHALTARDRPYKKAMPVERALSILGFEVKDGHIDGDLVQIFAEAEVFKQVEGY